MKIISPSCTVVKGFTNTALYNLDTYAFTVIPNKGISFIDKSILDAEYIQVETADDLLKRGYVIETEMDYSSAIAGLKLIQTSAWDSPSIITNAIVEISQVNNLTLYESFEKLISWLSCLICKHVFFKFNTILSISDLNLFIAEIANSSISTIQISIPYCEEYYSDDFCEIIIPNNQISYLIVENSPFEKNIEDKVFFTTRFLETSNGRDINKFVVNRTLFNESKNYHNYFNRKLYIDYNGSIKNAPECQQSFGNIKNISSAEDLVAIIESIEFRKYWYVNKDMCIVCKDCEFRYMCIDNRIPQKESDTMWYHLSECAYDPYSGLWKTE